MGVPGGPQEIDIDQLPVAAVRVDAEFRVVRVNPVCERLFGYAAVDVAGRRLVELLTASLPDGVPAGTADTLRSRLAGGEIIQHTARMRTGDGGTLWCEFVSQPVMVEGEFSGALALFVDVTEAVTAKQALLLAHEELRRLAREVLEAERLERDRIAEELHDDTIQVLTATLIQVDRMIGQLEDASMRAVAEGARSMLELATDRVRRMMFDLHPVTLGTSGLRAAVSELCDSAAQAAGFETVVDVPADRFDADVEELAFRTVREAVSNAVKHSGARTVRVEIQAGPASLAGHVIDDGRGFDAAAARVRAPGRLHLGIESMARRVRVVGGEFDLDTAPGRGTRLRFSIPTAQTVADAEATAG